MNVNTYAQTEQWPYTVEVYQHGKLTTLLDALARDALEACDIAESMLGYGKESQPYPTISENDQRIINAAHWHGYTFQARRHNA